MQLMLRVVLPRSRHPRTGEELKTLIRGTSYTDAGRWQQLNVSDIEEEMIRHQRVLRSQFGSYVDVREAYIDHVVINAYGGPGPTDVWIDSLELPGYVPMQAKQMPGQPQAKDAIRNVAYGKHNPSIGPPKQIALNGTVINVDGRPFVPRMIEHNGEPFDWLESLGFNTIKLKVTPTRSQLDLARILDLWLVAPPPQVETGNTITPAFDRVIAWSLGGRLAGRDFQSTQQLAIDVKQSDEQLKRPILCGVESHIWQYSRLADILMFDRQVVGTSFPLRQFGPWLDERNRLARPGTPFWVAIQTQPAHELEQQIVAMSGDQRNAISLEPDQIQLLVFGAVATGARGVCFKSRTRLDRNDPASQLRMRTMQWLNAQLALLEPWLAGGFRGETIDTSNEQIRANLLATERSQLVLLTRTMDDQQFVSSAADERPVSFLVPNPPSAPDVYQITEGGLTPLRYQRTAGGIRVMLDEIGNMALVVVTQDRLVLRHITQKLASMSRSIPTLKYELLSSQFQHVEDRTRELATLQNSAANDSAMRDVFVGLGEAKRMLTSGDIRAADRYLTNAQRSIKRLRRSNWEQLVRPITTPVSSPLCVSFDTLPQHLAAAQSIQQLRWTNNVLAAGDFENLSDILNNGWRQNRRDVEGLQTSVELANDSPRQGQSYLRMRARLADTQNAPAVVEAPPVWITSGAVPVKAGQLLKIVGWVKVPNRIQRSPDGLLIFDSLGGLPLAIRIHETVGWEPFAIYRAAPRDGEMRITFSLTGIGEVQIDGVNVSTADRIARHASR